MSISFDPDCRLCPRLTVFLDEVAIQHPGYHCAPVPAFGDESCRLLIVGLAPGMHGANRTGRPFTGDYAGILLYDCLHVLGLSSAPASEHGDDNLKLHGVRITNAVKCLPPDNKPDAAEVRSCNRYLHQEIMAIPTDCNILALGAIAHRAVLLASGLRLNTHRFAHGASCRLPNGHRLFSSYHCSRYNTQTGRLTRAMFMQVLTRALDCNKNARVDKYEMSVNRP